MRIFQSTRKLNLYRSLDTLKILTFWKMIKEKRILYLDFDYFDGKKYTDDEINEMEQLWNRLYDEYYILNDDSKSKAQVDKTFKELYNLDLINIIKMNCDFLQRLKQGIGLVPDEMITQKEQEVYSIIKRLDKRIKIKHFDGIDENIKYLSKYINALLNSYNQDVANNKKTVEK